MIIAPDPAPDVQRFITQHDHAHFASQLLELWREDGMPDHPRRQDLLIAAREHDNGWWEADSAPVIARNGRPHDFMTVPRDLRWEIWHRGTTRLVETEPYAAALIVRHALQLHRSHRDDPEWAAPLAAWQQLEQRLVEAYDIDRAALELDYRWIRLTDSLSLTACNRWSEPLEGAGYRAWLVIGEGGTLDRLCIDPFPLAGTTTLNVACRRLPRRSYTSDGDLTIALARARWQQFRVRVAPLRDGEPASNCV